MHAYRRAVALALSLAALPAAGADRLFPTDLLQEGEVDGSLDYTYFTATLPFLGSLDQKYTAQIESVELRIGAGDALQFGAAAPYYSQNEIEILSGNTVAAREDEPTSGDLDVWLDYGFIADPSLSLVGQLRWDTNSASDDLDGVEAALTLGSAYGGGTRAYGGLRYFHARNDDVGDAGVVKLGLFVQVASALRLVPEVFYQRDFQPHGEDDTSTYGGSLAAIVEVSPAVFVKPHGEYEVIDLGDAGQSDSAWSAGLTFYALFGGSEPPASAPRPAPAPRSAPAPATPPPPPAPAAPAAPPAPAAAAPAQPSPPPPPPPPVLAAGAKVTLPASVQLYPRPVPTAAPSATLGTGAVAELKSRIANAAGAWWFVDCVGQQGWVREAELQP